MLCGPVSSRVEVGLCSFSMQCASVALIDSNLYCKHGYSLRDPEYVPCAHAHVCVCSRARVCYIYIDVSKCSLYTFYNNPAPLNGSTQFHYCTDSNPGTGADDAFVLKRGVWRNATWPSHTADRTLRTPLSGTCLLKEVCRKPLFGV